MADNNTPEVTRTATPKFLLSLDGMGFSSSVKKFEDYAEVVDWGQDTFCHSSPQVSTSFAQKEPPTASPLYVVMAKGLHVPKLIKAMISKAHIKKGTLVEIASIGNTNTALMNLNFEGITVEEIHLGNYLMRKPNAVRPLDYNETNSFGMLLRYTKIEWAFISYKQDGGKEGQDTACLDIQTGEMT